MAKEKITARARAQYTDYMVKEPMELMEFLAAKMPDASRTKLKSLLSKRIIYVDSVITTQYNFPLKPGMKVQISREKGRKEFNHKLMKIVYEDAYIIVIEKMQGLLSVNTDRQKERTAYTILNEYVQRSGKQHRVHIVHRLDRDTSGLMMFAKDEKTQRTLRDNWHDIVTDRRYVAVVFGEMEKDAGTVVSWLTDRKLYVYSSPTDDGGQESITHYRTIKRANGYSLVELNLETGRKNQIRVHMQDLGHPIIGDGRYGLEDVNPIGRLALHAFNDIMDHCADEIAQFGKVTDAKLVSQLKPYGLVDDNGDVLFPIIKKRQDRFHQITEKLANSISAELKNNCGSLASQYGIDNEKVAMVMLYHEIMWDLVDNLIQDRIIFTPAIFKDEESNKERLNEVVFFIEGGLMQ